MTKLSRGKLSRFLRLRCQPRMFSPRILCKNFKTIIATVTANIFPRIAMLYASTKVFTFESFVVCGIWLHDTPCNQAESTVHLGASRGGELFTLSPISLTFRSGTCFLDS